MAKNAFAALQKIKAPQNRFYVGIGLFLLALLMLRAYALGAYLLMDETESRYAEIAREMTATGNWTVPQLEPGQPFWGKPPLSFWLTALSFRAFGINEFAARFPTLLLAVFITYLTFLVAKALSDSKTAFLSALFLATTAAFYVLSGSVGTDFALSASVTLSMASFIFALNEEAGAKKRVWGYGFFIGGALGLLAKGPVALVVIFIPVVLWVVWHGQYKKALRGLPWITGTALAAAVALPWYIKMETETPGFLRYFIVGEHIQRFLVSSWKGDLYGDAHALPRGTIWLFGLIATLPWNIVFAGALARLYRKNLCPKDAAADQRISYLLLWFLSPMMLFTMANNISFSYVISSLPAFAIMAALALKSFYSYKEKVPWYISKPLIASLAVIVPLCLFTAAMFIMPAVSRSQSQFKIVEIFRKLDKTGKANLVYASREPSSADFYSGGRAVGFPDRYVERVLEKLRDGEKDFYVIKKYDKYQFPPEFFDLTREAGHFKERLLFEEK